MKQKKNKQKTIKCDQIVRFSFTEHMPNMEQEFEPILLGGEKSRIFEYKS